MDLQVQNGKGFYNVLTIFQRYDAVYVSQICFFLYSITDVELLFTNNMQTNIAKNIPFGRNSIRSTRNGMKSRAKKI